MPPRARDVELRTAAALVFVDDLAAPLLAADDAHHLGEVLRLKRGETVVASDGDGAWMVCAFAVADGPRGRTGGRTGADGRFGLEPTGPLQILERPTPALEVGFSWAKAERTEWAVAKLAELGVDRITPLMADRTVVRPDLESGARREARLRRIVREAAMQSRRVFLPRIGAGESLDATLERLPVSSVALAEPGGVPLRLETPVVLVGPEGGWTPRELALVEQKVSLGDGVFRVETAALAAGVLLSALRSEVSRSRS